ncbi:PIG-L family deacetylase [Herbiconiux liukaitaii]|uniref:PIG-L family deacetylase n=1 Tax=Herbiconiux liukaitaii TaxID=3342799 RepID=UPI0035B9CBC2
MSFTHDIDGTAEGEWGVAFRTRDLAVLPEELFVEFDHVVVVAAHPDDETLGAAGLLARAYAAGVRITVLVATSGEASHPHSSTHRPADLARLRETETTAAVELVAPGATLEFAHLADGGLSEPAALAALREHLDMIVGSARAGRVLLVSPWVGDGHPDHDAACETVAAVAAEHGLLHLAYPIWLWHWASPDDPAVPWDALVSLPLDPALAEAKQRALAVHTSQVSPLSALPGDEVLLHERMLDHFTRPFELFVDVTPPADATHDGDATPTRDAARPDDADLTTAPAHLHDPAVATDYFDRLHERAADPWGFETRWYEQRKRAILAATLPDRRFADVLEVGCSTGVLSAELIARTTHRFVGVDVSEVALERARARVQGTHDPHDAPSADAHAHDAPSAHAHAHDAPSAGHPAPPTISFERMLVPTEWPEGVFDLVVVSEVGYYLDPADLEGLIDRAVADLAPAGAIVCCHWRHPVSGRATTGDDVHAAFAARAALEPLAHHLEEDFVLDVFALAPSVSVARREGIL